VAVVQATRGGGGPNIIMHYYTGIQHAAIEGGRMRLENENSRDGKNT